MLSRTSIVGSLVVVWCALPLWAGAHASPVEYEPAASAVLQNAPTSVTVHFSERIDPSASAIRVTGPSATLVSKKAAVGEDPKTLVAEVASVERGTYSVKWSVVSKDDGHFTRGEYTYVVGSGSAAPVASTFELVTASTYAEALGMTAELFGNGMLWALVILFALGVRPLLSHYASEQSLLWRGYRAFGWSAIALALLGALGQFAVKAGDLANLHGSSLYEGLFAYAGTVAGSATLWRMSAIVGVAVLFFLFGKKIFESRTSTWYEWALAALLCVFAYFRAVVSHATANPFHTEFSIGVNFVHLIEKDLWAGIALALALCALSPRLQIFLRALLPRAYRILAATVGLLAFTGAYIVWLHLETPANLLSTTWGETFIPLLVAALCLVGVRAWNTLVGTSTATLLIEAALALVVVYRSSVMILTSPPLHTTRTFDVLAAICIACAIGGLMLAALFTWRTSKTLFKSGKKSAIFVAPFAALAVYALILCALPYVGVENTFKKLCVDDGNMWHFMQPSRAGVPVQDLPTEGCMWGSAQYLYHFGVRVEYEHYRALGEAEVDLAHPARLVAGVPVNLSVTLTNAEGQPAELFVDMERLMHMVIVSKDQQYFAHIHAKETAAERASSSFSFAYTFPAAGEYLISLDYAHGVSAQSKQFVVEVGGSPQQRTAVAEYASPGAASGYEIVLKYPLPQAGDVATLVYTITKNGQPATDLQPYLGAPMHLSIVKNDFSAFVHTHGELHPPGAVVPVPKIVNGKVAHGPSHMLPIPPRFGPTIDAHAVFPTAGLYTAWAEFMGAEGLVRIPFTVRVE